MNLLMLLFGLMALAVQQTIAAAFNETVSDSREKQMITETTPPRESVTEPLTMPFAGLKVQLPTNKPGVGEMETDLAGVHLGRAENTTETTTALPFSDLWFNAGQSLGSAANTLSSWLNGRIVPQTTTTTTKPPEVIVRLQSNRPQRKPLISIDNKRKTEGNRIKPAAEDANDDVEDDDDEDDEEEYDETEEVTNNQKAKPNRKLKKKRKQTNKKEEGVDDEEEDENAGYEEEDEEEEGEPDDEEEEEEQAPPPKKRKQPQRKPNRPKVTNNRRGYVVDDEEDEENEYADNYDDEDDYYFRRPSKTSGRQQQQQQSLFNRFRQLAKRPNSNQQSSTQNRPGYRPVRIMQNGQVIQLVQDRPTSKPAKRRRRPSGNQNYQIVPIQLFGQDQKPKKRKANKPDPSSQFIIPLPQSGSSQKTSPQFISIPWSQLGLSNSQQEAAQNAQQSTPIIVNLQQYPVPQNKKRRRYPANVPSQVVLSPERKRLRRPAQNNQMVPVLTDETIRDIFKVPEIPPSRQPPENDALPVKGKRPISTDDMAAEELPTPKPTASTQPEVSVVEAETENDGNEDDDKSDESFLVIGNDDDDESVDEPAPRHVAPMQYLHVGGMKPYVDVLNKGRFYFQRGRRFRMAKNAQEPESDIFSISPAKEIQITTDNASDAKLNTPPTIAEIQSEHTSTTESPLVQ